MAETRQRAWRAEDIARLHERAAWFFDLVDQRERAEAERALARRARMRAIDSVGPTVDDVPPERAS